MWSHVFFFGGGTGCISGRWRQVTHGPRRWACSLLLGSVSSVSWRSSSGYLRMRWIGLMRNDSSVAECCWWGLCDRRNSCRATFDSTTINSRRQSTNIVELQSPRHLRVESYIQEDAKAQMANRLQQWWGSSEGAALCLAYQLWVWTALLAPPAKSGVELQGAGK